MEHNQGKERPCPVSEADVEQGGPLHIPKCLRKSAKIGEDDFKCDKNIEEAQENGYTQFFTSTDQIIYCAPWDTMIEAGTEEEIACPNYPFRLPPEYKILINHRPKPRILSIIPMKRVIDVDYPSLTYKPREDYTTEKYIPKPTPAPALTASPEPEMGFLEFLGKSIGGIYNSITPTFMHILQFIPWICGLLVAIILLPTVARAFGLLLDLLKPNSNSRDDFYRDRGRL